MFQKEKPVKQSAPASMNQFSAGTSIQGDIQTDGDMRMDGKLTGNIQSKAKVVIGASGAVEGNVLCQNGFIEGRVDGHIQASDMLILSKSAVVNGDISMKRLVVEDGARFNGRCVMTVTNARPLYQSNTSPVEASSGS